MNIVDPGNRSDEIRSSLGRIEVCGVGVNVWEKGAGRTLLYLHPGTGLEDHEEFLGALSARYRVIAPGHPGFEGSDKPDHISTIEDLAHFYLDFIEQLDLRDVILVGSSFGGWLAAEIATKGTGRIAGLVLIDPLGVKLTDRLTRGILDLFAIPLHEHPKHLFAGERRSRTYENVAREKLVTLVRNHDAFACYGWSPTLYNPKLKSRLHRITMPAQLVWGAGDAVVGTEQGAAFAKLLPDASFVVVEDAGHYPHVERTEEVVGIVDSFVQNRVGLPVLEGEVGS